MAIQHILVVDDSATDRFFLTELLQTAGFEVTGADSGEDCLEKVKTAAPDLVLMDVVMPGLTGFQVTRMLTKDATTAHVPVILITGKSQATDLAWALKMGAKACITKPVVSADLLALIKTL
ncbi:MAG TPA: response regulator [Methylotenera sp.]|nr:response regulator [Methylotenera sp.]HPH06053.1 response regulator [Methylotenera sp.]HPN00940.1 response regulator [Methylotenera sp.]